MTTRVPGSSEEALRSAALAVSTAFGENVFRELVRALATILEADLAFIALPNAARSTRMKMLAYYADGRIIEDFEYQVTGTPCETVIGQQLRVYPSRLQELFSLDSEFRRMGLQSYAGCPLSDARGKPIGLISVVLRREMDDPGLVESILKIFAARAEAEIERRNSDAALRASEEQYRAIFDASEDGIVLWASNQQRVDVNSAFERMFGWTREEALGSFADRGLPPEYGQPRMDLVRQALAGEVCRAELESERKNGERFPVEVRVIPFRYRGELRALSIIRDITERRRTEAALRASEEQYHSIFNASTDALVLWNSQLKRVDVNPAYERMLGWSRDEVLGVNYETKALSPEYSERRLELVRRTLAGEACNTELESVRKNGERFHIEVHTIPFQHRGEPHVLAILRDLTERKRAETERARLELQLRQAQKMEAIGHLAGGIAHDFNNILTGILGNLVLADERQATLGDAKLGRYLSRARAASMRARDLIQQMLTFSRGGKGTPRPVAVGPLAEESTHLLGSSLPSSIELISEVQHDVPTVLIDPVQVEQVLINLCINARDAMNGTGTIRLAVRTGAAEGIVCASCRRQFTGRFVKISVCDSGSGISPHVAERMFEPFFTTKEVGRGSGMGLAMVHGIVHENGGHVAVETSRTGTTFTVYLPPVAGSTGNRPIASRESTLPGNVRMSGHVLVVDDEQIVTEFMAELLKGWGLQVTVKRSPSEALTWFERRVARLDAVITDLTMPKMSGLDLARRLTKRRPGLPVLLHTGYAEYIDDSQLERAGVRALLRKPVEPAQLRERIEEALAAGTTAPRRAPRTTARKRATRRR